ncbi:MAG: class I SAM-dependent rRNA methyltransferase [Dongiaceae bacterium]
MATERPVVTLKGGEHRRVAVGHPWVFSNEVIMDARTKAIPPGSVATVSGYDGRVLGTALFNPHSLIAARLLARESDAVVDRRFLAERLQRARALRDRLFEQPFYRLAHAEADGFPGLIIDRFGETLVLQANSAGMERLLPDLLAALDEVLRPAAVMLRNDSAARGLEGLESYSRWANGATEGPIELVENGVRFLADPGEGQKTGWFFDQRENRASVARLAAGARVLDVYCYTGGFAVQAAATGAAEVLGVDRSEPALALAARSAALNGAEARCRFERGDAFATLETLAAQGEGFDIVVADPPAFVKAKKELNQAARGYRKLARLAAALVRPGGLLFIASCSHHMTPENFGEQVARGLGDAGRGGRIIRASGAGPDHPVHPFLPETAYLKALLLQID